MNKSMFHPEVIRKLTIGEYIVLDNGAIRITCVMGGYIWESILVIHRPYQSDYIKNISCCFIPERKQ